MPNFSQECSFEWPWRALATSFPILVTGLLIDVVFWGPHGARHRMPAEIVLCAPHYRVDVFNLSPLREDILLPFGERV